MDATAPLVALEANVQTKSGFNLSEVLRTGLAARLMDATGAVLETIEVGTSDKSPHVLMFHKQGILLLPYESYL